VKAAVMKNRTQDVPISRGEAVPSFTRFGAQPIACTFWDALSNI
jgi:hypothetical protein